MGRSFDELKAVAIAWHIPVGDLNHNDMAIAIYREMMEKTNMRALWETLDAEQRAFLQWLLAQRNHMAMVDELPGLLNQTSEQVETLLARVGAHGLCDLEEALVRGTRIVSAGDNL